MGLRSGMLDTGMASPECQPASDLCSGLLFLVCLTVKADRSVIPCLNIAARKHAQVLYARWLHAPEHEICMRQRAWECKKTWCFYTRDRDCFSSWKGFRCDEAAATEASSEDRRWLLRKQRASGNQGDEGVDDRTYAGQPRRRRAWGIKQVA